MMILPDEIPHDQHTFEPTDTAYLSIRGFQGILDDRPRTLSITDDRIIRWMDELIVSFIGPHRLSPACEGALCLTLLQGLADLGAKDDLIPPVISIATMHMQKHLGDPALCLEKLAEVAGISASHLSLLFREHFQTPPMRWLEELRMERAKQMLSAPYDSIKKVARVCGYTTSSYFCRAFRKNTGLSPGEFRRQHIS